ncbi:MAG TPA: hypothetical protein VFF79_05270 [Conexibacter sp.]|jgi:hypothetical protein|nr:hypothetical protein [Conexibacter sp.]
MGGKSKGGDGRSPLPRALAAAGTPRSTTAATPARNLTAGDAAWLAAIPTAAIAVLAIALLGPPLGKLLLAPEHARFWSIAQPSVHPEPVEQGRFLVALTVPLVLAALTAAGVALLPRRASPTLASLVVAIQAAAAGFVVVCLLQQHSVFGPLYPPDVVQIHVADDFTLPTLVAAAAATLAVVLATRRAGLRAALASWTSETRGRQVVAASIAIAAIVVWLLHGFNTEATIGTAHREVHFNIQVTLDETFAVLDGRSPLVNFAAQYGSLWPYAYAAVMSLLGSSVGVWVTLALCTTGLGMLAIFAVLRRAAHSSLGGLLLFLPVLATSFLLVEGTLENRFTFGNYFGTFPLRYAGPSLLAWVLARHLGGSRPRRVSLVFLVAGVVALNNADAGIPALGATVAALAWSEGRVTRAHAARLALEAAGGLAAAFALVSVLTLARAGALPDLGLLLRFSRLFARAGFGMYPMPRLGLHLVIYLTYVAALGVATVRALRAEPDRALTGMLAWSAVFGLGAGAYFVGRSTPDGLPAMFFPWSLTLALLMIPALRDVGSASWRRPPLAAIACVFGFLVTACSLVQTPTPWGQLHRLQHTIAPILAKPIGQPLVAQHTRRGEPVAILGLLGHRIAANLGIVNVSPYSNSLTMPTAEQLDETVAVLRRAGGRKVFLDLVITSGDMQRALEDAGFAYTAGEADGTTGLWVDRGRR